MIELHMMPHQSGNIRKLCYNRDMIITMDLPGPSRTIEVEPLEEPYTTPKELPQEAPAKPTPVETPAEPVPA